MRRITLSILTFFAVFVTFGQFTPTFDSVKFTPDGNNGGILYNVHISGDTLFLNSDTLITGASAQDSSCTTANVDTIVISGDSVYNIYVNGDTLFFNGDTLVAGAFTGYWTKSGSMLYPNNTSDNIGIGTTSPAYKLDVVGNTRLNGFNSVNTTPTSHALTIDGYTEGLYGSIQFKGTYGDSSDLTITGGYVTPATSSDTAQYTTGAVAHLFRSDGTERGFATGKDYSKFWNPLYIPSFVINTDSIYKLEGRDDTLFINGDTIAGGGGSLWSENGAKIYYNDGNVGIGTYNPQHKLHVTEPSKFDSTLLINSIKICTKNTQDNSNIFVINRRDALYDIPDSCIGLSNTIFATYSSTYNLSLTNQSEGNTFVGFGAGHNNTDGDGNTFIGGGRTGEQNTTGSYNTVLGNSAYVGDNATENVVLGYECGPSGAADGGTRNFLVHKYAGASLTLGVNNTFINLKAGNKTTTGTNNLFGGLETGEANTTGSYNLYLIFRAGESTATGLNDMIGLGQYSFANAQYSSQNAVGKESAQYCIGANNNMFGEGAGKGSDTGGSDYDNCTGFGDLVLNDLADNADDNTAFGAGAGENTTSGSDNTFVGKGAGNGNTTGTGNVYLGNEAGSLNTIESNQLAIDNSNTIDPLIEGDFSTNDVIINGDLLVTGNSGDITPGIFSDVDTEDRHLAIDVTGLSVIKINTSADNDTITGFTNGKSGQILYIFKSTSANSLIIEHQDAAATDEKIVLQGSSDITITGYGGLVLINNGDYWFEIKY